MLKVKFHWMYSNFNLAMIEQQQYVVVAVIANLLKLLL
jgi:hypothetical protein